MHRSIQYAGQWDQFRYGGWQSLKILQQKSPWLTFLPEWPETVGQLPQNGQSTNPWKFFVCTRISNKIWLWEVAKKGQKESQKGQKGPKRPPKGPKLTKRGKLRWNSPNLTHKQKQKLYVGSLKTAQTWGQLNPNTWQSPSEISAFKLKLRKSSELGKWHAFCKIIPPS